MIIEDDNGTAIALQSRACNPVLMTVPKSPLVALLRPREMLV